jgi:hypothetical protein
MQEKKRTAQPEKRKPGRRDRGVRTNQEEKPGRAKRRRREPGTMIQLKVAGARRHERNGLRGGDGDGRGSVRMLLARNGSR